METDRSSQLFERANKLEEKVKLVKNIASHLSCMHKTNDLKARTLLNNERLNLGARYIKGVVSPQRYWAIIEFAKQGDPLCQQMQEYLKSGYSNEYLFFDNSEIPQKLLTRTMTEQDYSNYLNGKKPISHYEGEHYLQTAKESVTAK